jgi:uracil-DNA glycosylase family 4
MKHEKPDYCTCCPLYEEPGPVPARGPTDAKMLYVGEAPGETEVDAPQYRPERMGPFIGGSGRIRNAILSHAGIEWKGVRTCNVVKCRPPRNRNPTDIEIKCCAKFLIEEIKNVNPNVIVAAGATPLKTLTGLEGISTWRGIPVEGFEKRKVFPTWHPAFIMRQQYQWPFAVHDMVRAKAQSEYPELRRVPIDIVINASAKATADDVLERARRSGSFCFDFETTGLSPYNDTIKMVGIGVEPTQAYVYDWTARSQQLFRELASDPKIEIVGQNVESFDIPFAEAKGFEFSGPVFDTMVAFHLCNASYGHKPIKETRRQFGAEKDLSFIASLHTDMVYWKSREHYKNDLLTVCGKDVVATARAAVDLKKELATYGMTDLYYKHVMPVQPILRSMHRHGIKRDEEISVKWSWGLKKKAQELEDQLKRALGKPGLNLASPQQLCTLLYDEMGLPAQTRERKGKAPSRTADAEALEFLAEKYNNPVLKQIVDIRHLRKMDSTFINVPTDDKGFVHPFFGTSKTANGRLNSWNPNGQNIPWMMREIYVSRFGKEGVLFASDWSQIEWRLAMVLSGDPVGLELLASGIDQHKGVYSEAFGKRIEDVTADERHEAKFIVYGLGYGRGAQSISEAHNIPFDKVQTFVKRFFERFKVYNVWRGGQEHFVKKNHYLVNPFMRRRWWYTRQITEMYNFLPASTAADMMYVALRQINEQLPKDAKLILSVHDEVVVDTPKDCAAEVHNVVRGVMEQTWPMITASSSNPAEVKKLYPNGWHCPAESFFGLNWKDCKGKTKDALERDATIRKDLGL